MEKVVIKSTEKEQVIDITEEVNNILQKLDVSKGVCHMFLTHTSAALTTADLDPGTDLDLLAACRAMIPKLLYRHPHNPKHVSDHILSSLIGTSLSFL